MGATKESSVTLLNSRRLAAFAVRVNEVIASLPYSENIARAIINDWLGREQARNIAEVKRCLENCSAHERGYWERKVEKVTFGREWRRGHPLCDLTWPDDDLDKGVRALAIRDFCGFADRQPLIHPKGGHYARDLVECTHATADLNGWLEALLRQLRSAGATWNDGSVVARPSDEKSLLRGGAPAQREAPHIEKPPAKPAVLAPCGVPPLSERQQKILLALLDRKAFGSDSRLTTAKIAQEATAKPGRSNNFKQPVAQLVKLKFVERKCGRNGGCWLTQAGRARAEQIAEQ